MLNLKNFEGEIYVNGERVGADFDLGALNGVTTIKLVPKNFVKREKTEVVKIDGHKLYRFTVRQYMTQRACPEFDFMAKFNNDKPMPLRTMTGWIEKETKGMVYAHLQGMAEKTITCMRCGRELTNPVSRAYGIGPECLCKLGIVANIDAVDLIKEQLVETKWDGWIIRSAITKQEEVEND